MKKIALLMVFVCMIISCLPAAAQDVTPTKASGCDLPALQKLIDTFIETLTTIKAKETDPATIMGDIQLVASIAASQQAICDGLSFSGKKQIVIGPVTIPAGFYRVKAKTTGPIIVNLTVVDGECESRNSGEEKGVFALNKGEATDGVEAVFTSKGCTALIEVSLIRADWQLSFEEITTS